MAKRLTTKSIRYAMAQLDRGRSTAEVAGEIGVTPRHVHRLRAKFHVTGTPHVAQRPGRPAWLPSSEEVRLVLDECRRELQGVLRTAMNLQVNHDLVTRQYTG